MAGGKKVSRRGMEPRHVRLYHTVTGCAAWHDLSGNAVKLLIALLRLDKGGHNGELFLSIRDAACAIDVHRNTVVRLYQELENHGFIRATQRGHFKGSSGVATTWRVTWQACEGVGGPTRDFEKWAPDGNKSPTPKSGNGGTKIVPLAGNDAQTGTNIVPLMTETSHSHDGPTVTETVPQVVSQGLGLSVPVSSNLKQPASIVGPRGSDDPETLIRMKLETLLQASPAGTQTRLAEDARIPGGTLSKFLREGKGLSRTHRISLQLAMPKFEAKIGGDPAADQRRSRKTAATASPTLS